MQRALSNPSRGGASMARHVVSAEFPLRRFMRCGTCGQGLTGSRSRSRSGAAHAYYHCKQGCSRARAEDVEAAFLRLLDALRPKPELWALFRESAIEAWRVSQQAAKAAQASSARRIDDLENRLERLDDAFIFSAHRRGDVPTTPRHAPRAAHACPY